MLLPQQTNRNESVEMQAIYTVQDLAPLIIKDYDQVGAANAEQQVRRLISKGIIKPLNGDRVNNETIRISRVEVLRLVGQL